MTTLHSVPPADEPRAESRPRVARFGVFDLDLSAGELRRSGIRVPLQDQPLRLLTFLLEHAGEVVTREDLHERLWPAEFVDFDHSLNTAVRKLRAALDDSADNPRFIETLSRRGYRFIAPVSWNIEEPLMPLAAEPAARRNVPLILAALLAAAIVAGGLALFQRTRNTASQKSVASVAVLPFINEDRDSQHISDGVTEILIDTLSRLPDLRVMAPTTVFRYKNAAVDPKRAGKELGVEAVVIGHIRRQADRYAVRVELIDVTDGAQIWGDRFEVPASDLPMVQNRVADELSNELRHGARDGRLVIAGRYTTTPEAYDLYTKGLYAWNRRGKDDLQHALDYFTRATQSDPKFAAAYAGLANTYGVMVGYGTIAVTEGTSKIIANAQKALDLDPKNAEAYVSLATTKYRNVWDFPGADEDYRRALTLNPNYATGHEWYADYLRSMGRSAESRREIALAYKLDPFSPAINAMMCYHLFYERKYREAIAFSRHAAELDSRFAAPLCVVESLVVLGDYESAFRVMEAAKNAENMNRREVEMQPYYVVLENAYRKSGRRGFFTTWAELATQWQRGHSDLPVNIASLYAQAGERELAFHWLEKAYERRVSKITNINVDPMFDPIRDDPRFDDLLRRIGLPNVGPPG